MSEEIKRWEYFVGTIGSLFGTKDDVVEDSLNELGEAGWEVVSVHSPANSWKITIVAKRPLTDRARRERSRPTF